jgi:pimeloyl-ACP methyl ester carboxylesterase
MPGRRIRIARPTSLVRSFTRRLAIIAVLAVALIGAAPAALAGRALQSDHDHATPTVVLVHGAWADGSSWSKVVGELQHDDYSVRVPPNPLRGLPSDSETVRSFLATIPGPIVLVGHSYGGAVITNAATNNPAVKALVYVDAFAPDAGETVLPLAGPHSALAVDPTTVFDFVPYPGAPAGDFDLYLKPNVFLNAFASGVPTRQALPLYATQRPLALSAGSQPSGEPAWKTIPSWYLRGTRDLIIPPSAQRFMAERASSSIATVNAGHLSLVSNPNAVTRLIEEAAHATD